MAKHSTVFPKIPFPFHGHGSKAISYVAAARHSPKSEEISRALYTGRSSDCGLIASLTFSGFPNGIREKLSLHSNGIVQDSHLLPFSPAIRRHLRTIKFMG